MSIQDLQKDYNETKYSEDLNLQVKSLNATDNLFIKGVPVGGASNPDVLYNINPSGTVIPKSICVFSGSNPFQMESNSLIYINNNRPQFNNGLQIYDRLFFLSTIAGRANGVIFKTNNTNQIYFTNIDGFVFSGDIEAQNITLDSINFSNGNNSIDGNFNLNLTSDLKVISNSGGFSVFGDDNFFEMVKDDLNRSFNINIVNEDLEEHVKFTSSDIILKYTFDKNIIAPNITSIQEQTDMNTMNIVDIETQTNDNTSNIQTLISDVNTNTTDIQNLQGSITTQTTDITDLQNQADTNTQNISTLQNQVNTLNNNVNSLNNTINNLNNIVSQNTIDINKLKAIIFNLTDIQI